MRRHSIYLPLQLSGVRLRAFGEFTVFCNFIISYAYLLVKDFFAPWKFLPFCFFLPVRMFPFSSDKLLSTIHHTRPIKLDFMVIIVTYKVPQNAQNEYQQTVRRGPRFSPTHPKKRNVCRMFGHTSHIFSARSNDRKDLYSL